MGNEEAHRKLGTSIVIRITSAEDYRRYLITQFAGIQVGDTREELNVSFEFIGSEPLGFVEADYCNALWNVIDSYSPPGLAPSADDLQTLDYYHDRGEGWFNGMVAKQYGYEIAQQVPCVEISLKNDIFSRRGVVRMTGDKCLETIQFLVRFEDVEGVSVPMLTLIANFRSSDAIKGLPADLFILRKMAESATEGTTVEWRVIMNAGSLHIYDKDRHMLEIKKFKEG